MDRGDADLVEEIEDEVEIVVDVLPSGVTLPIAPAQLG